MGKSQETFSKKEKEKKRLKKRQDKLAKREERRANPKKTFEGSDTYPRYIQIFEDKHGFQNNLSILDLLFHEGPESLNYLQSL